MTPSAFNRLHALRMENDQAGYDMAEQAGRFQRLANRHENGTAPRAVSSFNLFQTPPAVAARMAALLELKAGERILEPSAGLGRLLDAVAPHQPSEVVAVEVAPQCAGELYRQERPGVRVLQRDFLTVTPEEIGTFDAVIMNPPFHMRADIRHIEHAYKFLNPGGRVVALCLCGLGRAERFQPIAGHWEELPAGTFGKEGTRVPTAMMLIRE